MRTIPVDSTDAREQRQVEVDETRAEADALVEHARTCRGGWLGEDDAGRPRPCTRCRPWLLHAPCRLCSTPYDVCAHKQAQRRGPCCDGCDHRRR